MLGIHIDALVSHEPVPWTTMCETFLALACLNFPGIADNGMVVCATDTFLLIVMRLEC
jgi:hypothetical protein